MNLQKLDNKAGKVIQEALTRIDKTGKPDKLAVDTAQFILKSGGAKGLKNFDTLTLELRKVILEQRHNVNKPEPNLQRGNSGGSRKVLPAKISRPSRKDKSDRQGR